MVDGVVIARGMLGNFWFVRQAVHRLATGTLLPDLDFAERIALARRHLDMLCTYHGESPGAAHRPQVCRLDHSRMRGRRAPPRRGPDDGHARAPRRTARSCARSRTASGGMVPARCSSVAKASHSKRRRAPLETRDAPRGGAVIEIPAATSLTDHMNQSQFRQGITTTCYAALDVARLYSGLRRAEVARYPANFTVTRELHGQTCIAHARRPRQA